ncbi:hypothetical protein BC830DRAFT_1106074 [Chytriomyces sp. MP71]|nr:hypothetical protein BC830DRAFT_1106074 [Chytriomyces sp. MP71]
MGKQFDALEPRHRDWIAKQKVYFLATASFNRNSRVNVSPKGYESLVVKDNKAYHLDLTGSGSETIAHVNENARITVMLCAFEGPPNIMRLWCTARVVLAKHSHNDQDNPEYQQLYSELYPHWSDQENGRGLRAIIVMDIFQVGTSCGYGVPYFDYVKPRSTLVDYFQKKSQDEVVEYWKTRNPLSLDGIPSIGTRDFDKKKARWFASGGVAGYVVFGAAMLGIGVFVGTRVAKMQL